jgi:hypothetical protein
LKAVQSIDPVQPPVTRSRLIIGWSVVIGLSFLELMAAVYGRPSVLTPYPAITAFVAAVGQWVPMVHSFARCAARLDSGSGLMLALNMAFLPVKLMALYYAYPISLKSPDRGLKAFMGGFYVLLYALVGLVPAYIWGYYFDPGDMGLNSLNRKASALCSGGFSGFTVALIQGGFALVCAFFSLILFAGIFRSLINAFWVKR